MPWQPRQLFRILGADPARPFCRKKEFGPKAPSGETHMAVACRSFLVSKSSPACRAASSSCRSPLSAAARSGLTFSGGGGAAIQENPPARPALPSKASLGPDKGKGRAKEWRKNGKWQG